MARAKKHSRVRTWLIEAPLGAVRGALLSMAVGLQEALAGSATGAMSTSDPDLGWRPITARVAGKEYRRELNPLSQDQMLRVAHFLYTGNALAQFVINIPVALTIGRSLGYTLEYDNEKLGIERQKAEDLAVQAREYLDSWWEHPAHDFKNRAGRYARTYLVTGEILLLIPEEGINPTSGLFMLDYIDSALIAAVEGKNGLATTPGRVLVKQGAGLPLGFDVMLPTVDGTYEGQCFFFRHTGRLNSLRGMSDLIAQADWIDLHDNLLYTRADKANLSNTLVHDLKVTGAKNKAELDDYVKRFEASTGTPGGTFAHNEQVEHSIKVADLKEQDAAVLVRTVLLHVLGSKGFPEHWFGDAGSSNRASSAEQSDTAYKVLEELQEELSGIFSVPLNVAYDRLAAKQTIFPARSTGAVTLHPDLPKISERDISRIGGIVSNVESALDAAVASGRLSRRTAQRVSLTLVEKITGEHVAADDEQARIALEQAEIQKIEQDRQQAAAKAAADLAKQLGEDPNAQAGQGGPPAAPPSGNKNGSASTTEAVLEKTVRDLAARPIGDTHIHLGDVTVQTPGSVVEVHPEVRAPAVHVHPQTRPPAVQVQVQPAPVTVIPGQPAVVINETHVAPSPAPNVTVVNEGQQPPQGPLEVHIIDHPATEQVVERDRTQRIERTVTRPVKE